MPNNSFSKDDNALLNLLRTAHHSMSSISAQMPGGGGYSHTLPIRVCAAQQGRDFEAPDLEWGIHFRGVFQNGV